MPGQDRHRSRGAKGAGACPSPNGAQAAAALAAQLMQVEEAVQLPEDARQNQATARRRMEELQRIFASRHAGRCEGLRARLASLDREADMLRLAVATLQREFQEACAERTAASGDPPAEAAPVDSVLEVISEGESKGVPGAEPGLVAPEAASGRERGSDAGFRSTPLQKKAEEEASKKGLSPQTQLYNTEGLSPIVNRRRAEARFREATHAHENCMSQMKAETAELEKRMHKQQLWVAELGSQVLEAEISKTRYWVRLEKAERRIGSLSGELCKANDKIVHLLDDHLSVEDTKARSVALTAYLNIIGRADRRNEVHFTENKGEVKTLLERSRTRTACQTKLDVLMNEISHKQYLTQEILSNSAKLADLNEKFGSYWLKVVAALKESVFKMPRSKSQPAFLHPVAASQQLGEALAEITAELSAFDGTLARLAGGPPPPDASGDARGDAEGPAAPPAALPAALPNAGGPALSPVTAR